MESTAMLAHDVSSFPYRSAPPLSKRCWPLTNEDRSLAKYSACVGNVLHGPHSRHRSVRLHGVAVRRVNALSEDTGTLGRRRKDRVHCYASVAKFLRQDLHKVLRRYLA